MDYFEIADIALSVAWEDEEGKSRHYRYQDCIVLPRILEAYRSETANEDPDMKVAVHKLGEFLCGDECKKIYNQSFRRMDDLMIMTVYDPYRQDVPGYSITMSEDYSCVDFVPHIKEYRHYDLQWMMYPFEGKALYKGGIVLHGAAIEYNGAGIVFTGISGSGKSTQAHLWQKYRDALILNGDCPYIRIIDGVPKVFGTPWCGTSGESIRRSAALKAVVYIKKGERNLLRELTGNDAFLAVLSNVLRPNFDDKTLDLAIENLQKLIRHIRVFEITSTISEEAVEVLEKEIV
jgi:hypothetical protein